MKKTRILHIITKLALGGAQKIVILLADEFNNKRFYSEIACGPTKKEYGNLEKKARNKGIKIRKIKGLGNEIKLLQYILAVIQLVRYIRKNKFDIVHTHSSVAGILGRIAAKTAGARIIIHTVHGWGFYKDMNPIKKAVYLGFERLCARFTHRIICVSKPDIKTGLGNKIGRKEQYTLIRSGIDLKRFSSKTDVNKKKKELDIPINSFVVGTVSRFDNTKNPFDFVETARIVAKDNKNALFVFVGDGPLRDAVKDKIKKHGLEKNFRLLGFRNDVHEIIQTFDVSLLTSLWEGMPMAVVESLAAGKPVIANDIGGIKDAVKNGENGFLISNQQPETTAERLLYLMDNAKVLKAMGNQGKKNMGEFSHQRTIKDTEKLYSSLIKGVVK